MASKDSISDSTTLPACQFHTTNWSTVLLAGQSDLPEAKEALENLCQNYWYPLYAFVRRKGYSAHDAQDLTQEFFARLLEKNYLHSAEREKGRFRTFLLACLKHFLANEWDRAKAQKRGGGKTILSLDEQTAESRYSLEPRDETDPEKIFERRWALTLLEKVLRQLRQEYTTDNKTALFEQIKDCLTGEKTSAPYAILAAKLEMTEGALKVAVHRMRQRYGELLRLEIANTVATSQELDDEIRYLISALEK